MDIRQQFLDFFKAKGHREVASSPLVPDDPTLMFTNAGMVQFKGIFTGEAPIPEPPRATSSQLCVRAGGKHNDLDNVGYTARHHTLFEMLGNFSFADYFKEKAIAYAWEFITSEAYLGLPIDKLWVTVHESDDEAEAIWQKYVRADRILRFGDKDNFWQMGDTGPCGPSSEIFYDQGAEHFHTPEDVMGGEGDRFLEIWNLVFMQYDRSADGTLTPLPKPSIDTGMGLERVVAIKEGVLNNYHSTLFRPYLDAIGERVGKPYVYEAPNSASYRVIADHVRSVTFLLAQGVHFDKEGRGYVLRRIMRRAIRHGYLLGLREPFMYQLVDTIVHTMGEHYSDLPRQAEAIKMAMKLEEERFFDTIEAGIKLFNQELAQTKDTFDGAVAFKLYDTYGFPLDLTEDMLREKGIALDVDGFDTKMQAQRAQSKASWKGTGDAAVHGDFKKLMEAFGANEFVGYERTQSETRVIALLDEDFRRVERLESRGWVMLEHTPFYAESGGQVGDRGRLETENKQAEITVLDTRKFLDMNLSEIKISSPHTAGARLKVGDAVEAVVDTRRKEIEKHHSATHLLHAGLRAILGTHIAQAGSHNDATRLRFDFSHPGALSAEEIRAVETWVNDIIIRALPRVTKVMSIDEAKATGAMALFGEKYGDAVRVVRFGDASGDVSMELCGGTHVDNTAQIGLFMITKESGVSAGVRRIEAVCGRAALERFGQVRDTLHAVQDALKTHDPIAAVHKLKTEIKTLKNALKNARSITQKTLTPTKIGTTNVIIDSVQTGDIKEMIDAAKNRYDSIAIMLFQQQGDKVLLAAGSKAAPIQAGAWIKHIAPIIGGGGGGRPDFAQAGGKNPEKIPAAVDAAHQYLVQALEGGQ